MLTSMWKLGRSVLRAKSPSRAAKRGRRARFLDSRRRPVVERMEDRMVLSALTGAANPNEHVDTSLTPTELAMSLVGPGVSVSNVSFTGGAASTGSFTFTDPTVVGFGQGIVMSSGSAADIVGPNESDWTSTDFAAPGDNDLDKLSGFNTFDAAVLEFDFVPTANQVVFQYTFASDEYPEWVNTPYNDVFAFFVNGTNYAEVRQIAGDPLAPFVPVAVNNINNGNALYPEFTPMRPDLFRPNYFNPAGPSVIDLELDGLTSVLTFQAPVNPGEVNHMKLAIADASDGIYDSAVFIQSGSLVSNENPVADLSLTPERGDAPLLVTAIIEGEDPNGAPLTYSIDWGDGTISTGDLDKPTDDSEKTALADHVYTTGGEFLVTLTVSNGTLSSTSTEDVDVLGGSIAPNTFITGQPADPSNDSTPSFSFDSTASGSTFEYQLDGGGFVPGNSGDTLGPLADGSHTFEVRATDTAGVTDPTPASYTWTVDTLAPDTTIVAQPASPSSDTTPSFSFGSDEAGATFLYQVDGGSFVTGGSDVVLDPLADGSHTLQVQAVDAAGNTDPTPASYTWTVDTLAPDTTIVAQPASPSSDTIPSFSFGSDEAGVTFLYQVDGGSFVTGGSEVVLDPLADGSHTLQVQAVDAAGNIDPTPASYTWTVDTLAPDTTIVAQPASPSSDTTPSFSFGSDEAGVTFHYQVDGGSFVTGGSDVVLDPLADGSHTLQVQAVDAAGNIDPTPASYTWTVITAPAPISASIVNDPQHPGRTILQVIGTPQGESIVIEPWHGKFVQVRTKESAMPLGVFPISAFQRIVVQGMDGDDTIVVDFRIAKPAELHGDGGNDRLVGGSGNDEIFGGEGNDVLHGAFGDDRLFGEAGDDVLYGLTGDDMLNGGTGNNVLVGGMGDDVLIGGSDASLLIGGFGDDKLVGGQAGDILIGGVTKYDQNETALLSILAEWKRADLTYGQRIDHLTGKTAGGLNGNSYLRSSTVKQDGAGDSLWGGDGEDWFWALAKEVADRKPGERLN